MIDLAAIAYAVFCYLFLCMINFAGHWNFEPPHAEAGDTFAEVHLFLKRRDFVSAVYGRRWVPQGLLSKLMAAYTCLGLYRWKDGNIYLNLPAVSSSIRRLTWLSDIDTSKTDCEHVCDVIEHEALHSAISSCSDAVFEAPRRQVRSRFREVGLVRKTKMVIFLCAPSSNRVGAIATNLLNGGLREVSCLWVTFTVSVFSDG